MIHKHYYRLMPNPTVVRSTAQVCSRLMTGTAGSNSPESMDVNLLCLLRIVQVTALRRSDNYFRGVLPAVCVFVCDLEISPLKLPTRELGGCATTTKKTLVINKQ